VRARALTTRRGMQREGRLWLGRTPVANQTPYAGSFNGHRDDPAGLSRPTVGWWTCRRAADQRKVAPHVGAGGGSTTDEGDP
jgi:hypothetical protein